MAVSFFVKDVQFAWNQEAVIRQWIEETISSEKPGRKVGEVSIVFCSDEYLLDINRRYLDHDYYTDIITFPYTDDPLSADLYISIDRVKENASNRTIEFWEELARVIIHGILHLCDHPDKTEEEKLKMRSLENFYLSSLLPLEDVKYKWHIYSIP